MLLWYFLSFSHQSLFQFLLQHRFTLFFRLNCASFIFDSPGLTLSRLAFPHFSLYLKWLCNLGSGQDATFSGTPSITFITTITQETQPWTFTMLTQWYMTAPLPTTEKLYTGKLPQSSKPETQRVLFFFLCRWFIEYNSCMSCTHICLCVCLCVCSFNMSLCLC